MSTDPHTSEAAALRARQEAADHRLMDAIEQMLDHEKDMHLEVIFGRIIDDARGDCMAEDVADYTIGVRDVAKILRDSLTKFLEVKP